MRIRVLGAYGAEAPGGRHASAFLLNERILLDAGGVTSALPIAEQMALDDVLLSHAHLDHVAGLGYLSEARALNQLSRPLTLCATAPIVAAMQRSFFNNTLWPDFSSIPNAQSPIVKFRTLTEQAENDVGGLRVTPVGVSHSVPCSGFIMRADGHSVVYSGDTGPTDALWTLARQRGDVTAVILECSFPNRLARLAADAKHMTPHLVANEIAKLPPGAQVLIFHIKPLFYDETADELKKIGSERIVLLEQGNTYDI